ncbi:hypothetical protein ccbrp13_60940 [Ktedonobacteria bacterium brp13]|nr:hypothetical protein ccbrp13_60940 [Ktedonobacteria bacterium brp13]
MDSFDSSGYRDSIRYGSASSFSLQGFRLPAHHSHLVQTPILVLGAGAAGTLITRTLVNAGYQHIHVLDDRGHYGGIWNQKNVYNGSRNNPIPLMYEQFRVEAAPGMGHEITSFLADLADPARSFGLPALPEIQKAKVLHVFPGDLTHQVVFRDERGEQHLEAPIVINTMGLGKPLSPSRNGVMTTDIPASAAGNRWQQVLTLEQMKKLQGKMLVFIGLGNSTAEMLVQIQHYIQAGLDLRYKVLTHYPEEVLRSPNYPRHVNGQIQQLYRDIDRPKLTKLAGDLEHIERAFTQARDSRDPDREEIISSVTFWTLEQTEERKQMRVRLADETEHVFAYDQLYTLIGYGHAKEELEALGMWVTDDYLGTIASDYDGEIQRLPGAPSRMRLYPGYFALGALLRTPQNPNALVIPGMLYRLADQFSSIVFRSIEYAMRQEACDQAFCSLNRERSVARSSTDE